MHQKRTRYKAGFTLIELLVVIAILGILFTVVLQAINPSKQFAKANNTKRKNDVQTISNAISQYVSDNHGSLPASFSSDANNPSAIKSTGGVNLCNALVPKYVAKLPVDPKLNATVTDCTNPLFDSGYTVYQSASDGRVTILAPRAELSEQISVTR